MKMKSEKSETQVEQVVWIVSASGPYVAKASGGEMFVIEENALKKARYLTRKLRTEDCSPKFTAHRMLIREYPEAEEKKEGISWE